MSSSEDCIFESVIVVAEVAPDGATVVPVAVARTLGVLARFAFGAIMGMYDDDPEDELDSDSSSLSLLFAGNVVVEGC